MVHEISPTPARPNHGAGEYVKDKVKGARMRPFYLVFHENPPSLGKGD